MPPVAVRILPSMSDVSRQAWHRLFPATSESWDFFRACELAPAPGFSTSVLAAFVGEDLVGAAPLFDTRFRLDMAMGPRLGAVTGWLAKRLPGVLDPSILAVGSPQSDECPIGIIPAATPGERAEILEKLLQAFLAHADAMGAAISVLKDVRDADTAWAHAPLAKAGFARMASLPLAILELPYQDENEYLATFSPRFRSEMRRKMRQSAEVTTETRSSIDDVEDEITDLFQKTRASRRADYGSFDDVGPRFFHELLRALDGKAQVMLARHSGKLVSFNLFLVEPERVLAKFIGMRYPEARELNLYYYNWMMMVRYCIEHRIPVLQTGQTTYEIKTRLGSKLKKSWIYARHRRPLVNRALHAVAPYAALDKSDPDLRTLGTEAPYVPSPPAG